MTEYKSEDHCDCNIGEMIRQTTWISVKDEMAPKKGKFLFHYHCGVGLGAWGQSYTDIHGNSERTHEAYFLVLWPQHVSENDGENFEWDEDKMIEMDFYWMPLPKPPKE